MPESNVFIPLSDGVRLAASVYLPETQGPWPALLEALPYRKDDLLTGEHVYRRLRNEGDYAVCRLDVRGTGSSDGIAVDEYLPQEQDDLCEVVEWLSRQGWCTGAVGMFGTSYSGFNTIQTAMRRPPALRAIVPIYATDDRYTDDIHFGGGIRKMIEFGYPLFMVSMNALPPVPSLAGDVWRQRWIERIDELVPWYGSIEEQNDGPFWRQGSLRPNYDLIDVPMMIVAGWADLYRNSALRMMEHLRVPKRLLMGPWCHMSPNRSIPGPRIDLVPEMIRWWDRWLREVPNGVDEEPPIAFFIQRSTPPEPDLGEVRGEWRFEPAWPPERRREHVLELASADRAGRPNAAEETLAVRGDVGTAAHIRGSYDPPYGLPLDQRPDDAYSLVYEWPVEEELEILGNPRLEVTLRASSPVAFVSAKVEEVLEDGTSVLVSRGILNLTHRVSHTSPELAAGGQAYDISLELDATSRVFEPGRRIRLAIAGADWPNAWPPPEAGTLTIDTARTRLVLPAIFGPSPVEARPAFPPPPEDSHPTSDDGDDEPPVWLIERDVYGRETRVVSHGRAAGSSTDGSPWWQTEDVRASVRPLSPGTAGVEAISDTEIAWPEVTARARARLELRSDPTRYLFDLGLEVYENGELLRERHWERVVPRKLQ
ncbi:MAG: CocE/NonD family hydrolase [Actinomycetota bacterium]